MGKLRNAKMAVVCTCPASSGAIAPIILQVLRGHAYENCREALRMRSPRLPVRKRAFLLYIPINVELSTQAEVANSSLSIHHLNGPWT